MVIKTWDKNTSYDINDIVCYANKFFISITDDNTEVPIIIESKSLNSTNVIVDSLDLSITTNNSWRLIEILN